ncbi:AfsR/SARP family transcriptional regulator [Lentzea albida]|uniref:DNA-binding transcriptional activator of the SARP family n=1 Tax=Lentzea albida TaxID=65499 RepID=A0A1H9CBZ5_9PSEU|nr:AfsR/SARP family transcriptional regulator [Lentzea albida]SEP98531.1 DNA-binding transcriptional activator of the SARP family [Lentzea albida]
MIVQYRVLGPLEVLLDGEPVPVPAGRGRVLLATLLLRANEIVPVPELVDRVWDGRPPAPDRAHKTLQMVVTRLRQSLGEANCVRTSSRGYTAEVGPGQLDLAEFRRLTARGEHRAALALWRGPVLGDVTSESLHREDVPELVEEQLTALERRIDEDLAGATDVLVPELRSLTEQHPLREAFWAQLMLALHRTGRQAEALAAYQTARRRLADELGTEPGARLREAQDEVLSGETPGSRVVPRQLPPAHPHFVGREAELARLTEVVAARPGEPVLISAINGIGGVGKTVLAVQWAHQVAHRFPDGQLHVDLRGFDTRAEPLDPHAAIRVFLQAMGVGEDDLPSSGDALVALYRSVLAGRRVLVLLDNARDADQVRPLLPGGTGNLVLITSRDHLSGLVDRAGARPVALDVMDDQAAVALLAGRIGAERTAAEPDAVARLVERCAGLPLALGIVAARAAYGDRLTVLAEELERERLDALDVDDPTTAVRAVFSWSLRSVSGEAATMFTVLGLHPGPDFTVEAAASLAASPVARAGTVIAELVAGSLLTEVGGGRYSRHDLLRDYAAERAAELPAAQRSAALGRMFDHYLHTSLVASDWLAAAPVDWTPLAPPADGAEVVALPDLAAAHSWYDRENQVLQRVVSVMVAANADDLAWRLAYSLHLYLVNGGRLAEAEAVETLGLEAAQRLDDAFALARLHRSLAGVHVAQRDFPKAEVQIRAAMRCEVLLGREDGQSNLARGLAYVYENQGRDGDALAVLLETYRLVERCSPREQASLRAELGRAYHRAGDHERGLALCLTADEWFREEYRDLPTSPMTGVRQTIADIYLKLGRVEEAVRHHTDAVGMMRVMRETLDLADALTELAGAHTAAGDRSSAREALAEALDIFERLEDKRAAEVRELLISLTNV